MFIIANTTLAQSGVKYADGGNILSTVSRFGSNNYADINFYTNSQKQMVLTKDGNLNLFGQSRFYKNSVFDSLLTAFAIRVQTIQANSLTVIYNAQIGGLLTVGNTLNFDGSNQTISSTTGNLNFSNNNLSTTGTINANDAAINNNLSALNITATNIQTQTINTGELLINGQPPQVGDTINVNVVNAGNIVIDGPATQIYSTNGVIDFNNNNIKNVGKLTVSQLGINTPNPIASMQVSGTDELNTTIGLIRYSDDDRSSRLSFVKYRGTMANPKPVLSGDRLGIISYHGFDGVQFQSSDMIKGVATENFNPTGRGSKIEFSTTPNGSTTDHIALTLDNDQTARFANTVYAPNIVISDKIITKEAEFDSLRINEKLYVEKEFGAGRATFDTITIGDKIYANGSLTTDTIHAIKQISVNNTLQVEKQDTTDYAEIFTKDESSLYIQSKEGTAIEKNTIINAYTGKVGIGTTAPSGSEKLTVVGNTRLQGEVNVTDIINVGSGNTIRIDGTHSQITSTTGLIDFGITGLKTTGKITVDSLSATCFNVGSTQVEELNVNKIIKVGTQSLVLSSSVPAPGFSKNSIYTDNGNLFIQSESGYPNNTVINSNNTGKVGIGVDPGYFTNNPNAEKTTIMGDLMIKGDGGFDYDGEEATLFLGDETHFIRSIHGGGLRIGTHGAEDAIMLMQFNGYVGIGTENPQKKLHVVEISEEETGPPHEKGGSLRLEHIFIGGTNSVWDIEPVAWSVPNEEPKLNIGPPNSPKFTITESGKVGIGTTSPTEMLDIFNLHNNVWMKIRNSAGNVTIGFNGVHGSISSSEALMINWYTGKDVVVGGGDQYWNMPDGGAFTTLHNTTLARANGNVGIGIVLDGTNNPNNYKLAVNGVIGARDLIIEENETDWGDYVFDNDYKLMPLNELDSLLKLYKHLPDMPSADCVKEKGLSLAEYNAKLLIKVEELTLYIIELHKQNEKLSKRLSILENN